MLFRSGVGEANVTKTYTNLQAVLWSNTAAITSVTLTGAYNNFAQYSTFYLYGVSNSSIQNSNIPYASGGDVIVANGGYWYHAFKYSGTFTPKNNLSADLLVIAGGGGSNPDVGGGAGAGGILYFAGQSLAMGSAQTVTVGEIGRAHV